MKIVHKSDIDYVSIDFKEGVESKSFFQDGVLVRLDKSGNVLGLDITDSSSFFSGSDELTMKEACELLSISEYTMRRRIREGKVKHTKPNKKDFRFKRKDLLKIA